MAAMTVARVLDNSAAAEILQKQHAIQAEFDRVQKQIDELTQAHTKMSDMKDALAVMVANSSKSADSTPDWLNPAKFPSELSVEPSKITKVHDWAEVMTNAFNVGPGGDSATDQDTIQNILYAIQSWTARSEWTGGVRGTVENVKLTRIALSPEAAYYEGEWGSGVDIYKTTDGETFELWFHEYEQYPSCYPQLIKGELSEGSEKGTEFVYIAWESTMCSRVTLSDGSECWVADKSKKIPEEVHEMEVESE